MSVFRYYTYQFRDDSNVPLSGGTFSTYLAGTDIPTATYTAQFKPIGWPLQLDVNGAITIFCKDGVLLRANVTDANGVNKFTFPIDNFSSAKYS